MTAADCHRPLLVVHDAEEGHLVYDLRLCNEETLELRPFPRPVVQPLHYRPLAVSGGTILGAPPHELQNRTDSPIMLPVGDSTVMRMDRAIHGSSIVEALLLLPGGPCHTIPLPRPPIGTTPPPSEKATISAYFVMGTRVWICVSGKGTFSFDTEHGTWRVESDDSELLPFEGRAFFVPELGAVVGLGDNNKHLYGYDYYEETGFEHTSVWVWDATLEDCANADNRPSDETVSLAHLGQGRFCVCRGVEVLLECHTVRDWPTRWCTVSSLVVMEVARYRGGEFDGSLA